MVAEAKLYSRPASQEAEQLPSTNSSIAALVCTLLVVYDNCASCRLITVVTNMNYAPSACDPGSAWLSTRLHMSVLGAAHNLRELSAQGNGLQRRAISIHVVHLQQKVRFQLQNQLRYKILSVLIIKIKYYESRVQCLGWPHKEELPNMLNYNFCNVAP